MAGIIPVVGSKGKFVVKAPFERLIKENDMYECIAVRTFTELRSWGRDPYKAVYEANGLSREAYEVDLANNEMMVSLQSSFGEAIIIPTSYIMSSPIVGGVPYNVMGIIINLGALADDVILTELETKVKEVTDSTLGVSSSTSEVKLSNTHYLSNDEHIDITTSRESKIVYQPNLQTQINQLTEERDRLQVQVNSLTKYIKDNL